MRCVATPFPDCAMPLDCPVAGLRPFLGDDACPVEGCAVAPSTVLVRAEQKLVDSMMVVDPAYLAQTTAEPLILVSADDDLWPGIRFAPAPRGTADTRGSSSRRVGTGPLPAPGDAGLCEGTDVGRKRMQFEDLSGS